MNKIPEDRDPNDIKKRITVDRNGNYIMNRFTVDQYIERCKIDGTENFKIGLDTVMESLRPLCFWEISASCGNFEITRWDEGQYAEPPTSQEIRDEFIRQQTIIECYEYFTKGQKGKI